MFISSIDNPKIEFLWHSVVEEIVGDQKVEALKVKQLQSGQLEDVAVDGVFVYVGTRANSGLMQDFVQTDERGYIITDEQMATSTPGLFIAGDVRRKSLRQVVTAVANGAIAAMEVEKYLASRE